jgi:hypothetical protein
MFIEMASKDCFSTPAGSHVLLRIIDPPFTDAEHFPRMHKDAGNRITIAYESPSGIFVLPE